MAQQSSPAHSLLHAWCTGAWASRGSSIHPIPSSVRLRVTCGATASILVPSLPSFELHLPLSRRIAEACLLTDRQAAAFPSSPSCDSHRNGARWIGPTVKSSSVSDPSQPRCSASALSRFLISSLPSNVAESWFGSGSLMFQGRQALNEASRLESHVRGWRPKLGP